MTQSTRQALLLYLLHPGGNRTKSCTVDYLQKLANAWKLAKKLTSVLSMWIERSRVPVPLAAEI